MENLLEAVVKLLVGFVSVLVAYFLIPWLKEKRIYSIVKKAVEAAEKLSDIPMENSGAPGSAKRVQISRPSSAVCLKYARYSASVSKRGPIVIKPRKRRCASGKTARQSASACSRSAMGNFFLLVREAFLQILVMPCHVAE